MLTSTRVDPVLLEGRFCVYGCGERWPYIRCGSIIFHQLVVTVHPCVFTRKSIAVCAAALGAALVPPLIPSVPFVKLYVAAAEAIDSQIFFTLGAEREQPKNALV